MASIELDVYQSLPHRGCSVLERHQPTMGKKKEKQMFWLESLYPNIAYIMKAIGCVDFGYDVDSYRSSFIAAPDRRGMIWEGKEKYESPDRAFRDLEEGLGE